MRWVVVVIYAMAMAWVESAVVLYLRTMLHRLDPYQAHPMPMIGNLGGVEVVREAATLIMLLTVGFLAGKTWRGRIGYAAIAFGVWDIFYYVFLKVMCGWPHSLFDWDVLFLIPLPWWGPVISPMLIALLMILWGTLASQKEGPWPEWQPELAAWAIGLIGAGIALWVFMIDAIHAAPGEVEAVRNVLPQTFHWPLFGVGLILMGAPVFQLAWHFSGFAKARTLPQASLAKNLEVQ
jgi:hypothetical protein